MEMDLSGFQLMEDGDMLSMSQQHIQDDIDLLFQSNNTNTFNSNKTDTYKTNGYENKDILTPLMSPAITPSFTYRQHPQNTFTNQLEFQLTSPAMLPQKNTNPLCEQYETNNLLQQHSHLFQNQGKSAISSSSSTYSPLQSPHIKPVTPASLMNMSPLFQSPVVVVSSHYVSPHCPSPPLIALQQPLHGNVNKKKRLSTATAATTTSSPRTLKPLLISPQLSKNAEHMLATRSNYQHLMEGKAAALGIAFTTHIKSGLEIRRTAHKAAEQKRRDSLKECFERLRVEVEEGYVKQQHPFFVPQVMELTAAAAEEEEEQGIKPLSKVLLLQYAYEYIVALKSTLDEKDTEIQNIMLKKKRKRANDDI